MINTSRSVKTWGTNQASSLKSDNTHYEAARPDSAVSQQGSGGGAATSGTENVGDILNRIADPSGSDAAKKAMRKPSNQLDKDDFLKLMLAQMKNQDPMNPMQSHEMASQLAQFTSLEQLFNVNKNLEGLKKQADPAMKFQALTFLGKSIRADSKNLYKGEGPQAADIRFELKGDANKIKVNISDETGNLVKSMDYSNMKKGVQSVSWAGLDTDDRPTRAGHYFVSIEAENSSGGKVAVQTETHGTITGVNYTNDGPMLMVGNQKVRLQDVQEIVEEPKPSSGEAFGAPIAAKDLNQMMQQLQNQGQSGEAVKPQQAEPINGGSGQKVQQQPQSSGIDPTQLTKVNKNAKVKDPSNFNAKASLPLEVEGGGIKTEGAFTRMAKSE